MVVLAGVVCSCDDKSRRLLVLYLSLNFHLLSVVGGWHLLVPGCPTSLDPK